MYSRTVLIKFSFGVSKSNVSLLLRRANRNLADMGISAFFVFLDSGLARASS